MNDRIFTNYDIALVTASTIAVLTRKVMIVGMDCETGKFHILNTNSPELMDTVPEEMDGEMVEVERFVNCVNVHPRKVKPVPQNAIGTHWAVA
jgi:hypothetical protein